MTDNEISRAMALAIGYLPEHVGTYMQGVIVSRPDVQGWGNWCEFDYRDPDIILPLLIHFEIVIYKWIGCERWSAYSRATDDVEADSYHKAAALAIIKLTNE